MGRLHALLLRPLGEARTWRATLHLLGAIFWSVANTLVLLVGLALVVTPVPALLMAAEIAGPIQANGTASAWLVLLLLLLTLPLGVLAFIGTTYALEGCARLEVSWHRAVLGVDIPLALGPRARGGSLLPLFGKLVVDRSSWRLMAYQLVRLPVALLTGALTVLCWLGPPVALIAGAFYFIGAAIDSMYRPYLHADQAWESVPVLLLALLTPAVPYAVRWMLSWHLGLARRYLGQLSAEQLAARVFEVEQRREDAMAAAETERRRIERDLHDGAQQQLVALAMLLGRAKRKYDTDPEATRALLEEAHHSAKEAIVELRELTRGLSPPVLADRGLDAALSALSARSEVPVSIDFDVAERPGRTAESIAYFMIAESLTNIAKHARASRAWVIVRRAGGLLRVSVGDDGVGGAVLAGGSGLAGLADRAAGVDGTLTVTSPAGGPTTVSLELPCES
ncbi:sensor histidine kinase [Kutzneria kofuensis]|uniref:histidine kinase n=1 Tax=Kutzneria kofuensis TaxID=103725 RepID=A0A7W9NIU4_9PSEU|nr:sensor histidine kinase [Kutzneria kofuensis]MBB5893934.1 signal transduction histidine kinase [Kutzneria kofuensis]